MSQRSALNKRNQPMAQEDRKGATRGSAASAKPARAAAAGVRTVSGSKKGSKAAATPQTKEERKAQRAREREEADRIAVVSNIVVKENEEYKQKRRVWWVMLGIGIAATVISWLVMFVIPGANGGDISTPAGIVSTVSLIAAYVFIIGAFVYEFIKVRPLRNEAERKVRGMGEKKRQAIIDADYKEQEERRAAKAAAKAARKQK